MEDQQITISKSESNRVEYNTDRQSYSKTAILAFSFFLIFLILDLAIFLNINIPLHINLEAGLVYLSFPSAIILGIMANIEINKTKQKGRTIAMISIIGTVILLVFTIYALSLAAGFSTL